VLVFKSADRDYFISHVDLTRIAEYRQEAARLTGEPSRGQVTILDRVNAIALAPTAAFPLPDVLQPGSRYGGPHRLCIP
jgi:hypothetical protein